MRVVLKSLMSSNPGYLKRFHYVPVPNAKTKIEFVNGLIDDAMLFWVINTKLDPVGVPLDLVATVENNYEIVPIKIVPLS